MKWFLVSFVPFVKRKWAEFRVWFRNLRRRHWILIKQAFREIAEDLKKGWRDHVFPWVKKNPFLFLGIFSAIMALLTLAIGKGSIFWIGMSTGFLITHFRKWGILGKWLMNKALPVIWCATRRTLVFLAKYVAKPILMFFGRILGGKYSLGLALLFWGIIFFPSALYFPSLMWLSMLGMFMVCASLFIGFNHLKKMHCKNPQTSSS